MKVTNILGKCTWQPLHMTYLGELLSSFLVEIGSWIESGILLLYDSGNR